MCVVWLGGFLSAGWLQVESELAAEEAKVLSDRVAELEALLKAAEGKAAQTGSASVAEIKELKDQVAKLNAEVREQEKVLEKHTAEKERQLGSLKMLLKRFQMQPAIGM